MSSSPEYPLVALVEELVDASLDTIELALDSPAESEWPPHVEYLKALQRQANGVLAALVPAVELPGRNA
jgi:hypothetical protein